MMGQGFRQHKQDYAYFSTYCPNLYVNDTAGYNQALEDRFSTLDEQN